MVVRFFQEDSMINFVGVHFEVLVLVAFGAFGAVLGLNSLMDALKA